MKKGILAFAVLFISLAGSLQARESYLGFSVGLMPDVGNLGETITKDGLYSLVGKPSLAGASPVTGCRDAADPVSCQTEQPGNFQRIIYPENELIALEKNTAGLFKTETAGAMTGLVLNIFYEQEFENTFWRAGFAYNRKVLGGDTSSTLMGVKWYDIHWDYKVLYIPAYFGIKHTAGETTSIYGALGMNYHEGGFDVGGRNIGDIPTTLLGSLTGPVGTTTVYDSTTGKLTGGPVLFEQSKFRGHGFGFAVLLGFEKKLKNGNKWFIEVNHIFASSYGSAQAQDLGGVNHLSAFPTFIVTLAGTFFDVGYKLAM